MKIFKLKPIILIILIILGISAIYSYIVLENKRFSQNPRNCITCHEMKPAFYTWQKTTHNQLNCTVCHQVSITKFRYKHKNGYPQPVKLKEDISSQVCLQCHDKNKSITPPKDLIIPHQLHMQKGLDCIDCHNNIAHANSVDKLLAAQLVTPKEFGPAEADLLLNNNNGVPMSKCLDCHNGKMAPKDCRACHRAERLPSFHQKSDWGYNHGTTAFINLNSCNKCHGEDLALTTRVKIDNNSTECVINFARYNLFCQNCHKERPLTHINLFAIDHAKKAAASREGCFVCHNTKTAVNYGNIGQPATNIYCSKCHFTKHPQDWINSHKTKTILNEKAKCLICHYERTSCNKCHQKSR